MASPGRIDAPITNPAPDMATSDAAVSTSTSYAPTHPAASPTLNQPQLNGTTSGIASKGTPEWEAAKQQVMKNMTTADSLIPPSASLNAGSTPRGGRGGRGGRVASSSGASRPLGDSNSTPDPPPRGNARGRPRGRGRGGSRGGKRKREDRDDDSDDSDSSEVYTPVATMTKSGRSIQKPTSFVPPSAASPPSTKRKRLTYRRNPESAVCKSCLRGTSPAKNMIVFCDGCNAPYHRFCHKPPIDQSVIDVSDKEWYCKRCEEERALPLAEEEVAEFQAAPSASSQQRQAYFASLAPGLLVTLLIKATTLHPDLPMFGPDFNAIVQTDKGDTAQQTSPVPNGHPDARSSSSAKKAFAQPAKSAQRQPTLPNGHGQAKHRNTHDDDQAYGPDEHPPHYPRPGQGLMQTLPPDSEDLHWLVDDDSSRSVFTHLYHDPGDAPDQLSGGEM